jgi:hypothetical protein
MSDQFEDRYEDAGEDEPYTPLMKLRAQHPFARLRDVIEDDRLDTAALIWMACVVAYVGAQIWNAFGLKGSALDGYVSGWERVLSLATTGTVAMIVAVVIGVAIAAATDSRASRLASTLAVVVAGWEALAGFLFVVYAAFAPDQNNARVSVSGTQVVAGLAVSVLGMLVAAAAWRIATSMPLDAEAEPAAVS